MASKGTMPEFRTWYLFCPVYLADRDLLNQHSAYYIRARHWAFLPLLFLAKAMASDQPRKFRITGLVA